MIKSNLDQSIEYKEIKKLDSKDKNYETALYEVSILEKKCKIALGKEKDEYKAKNILYYYIYLIKNEKVKHCLGIYEVFANKIKDIKDTDGDVDLNLLNDPLLFSYIESNIGVFDNPEKIQIIPPVAPPIAIITKAPIVKLNKKTKWINYYKIL